MSGARSAERGSRSSPRPAKASESFPWRRWPPVCRSSTARPLTAPSESWYVPTSRALPWRRMPRRWRARSPRSSPIRSACALSRQRRSGAPRSSTGTPSQSASKPCSSTSLGRVRPPRAPMGDRLRILLLYETLYPATIGGIEQRNAELAASLAGLGHRVTLAGLGRATGSPGVNVVSLGEVGAIYSANGRRSLSHTLRFVRSLRDLELDDFDIVETANQFYLHLFPLARACRRARVPLVVTWYEHWGPYWQRYSGFAAGALGRLVEARAAHRGDAVAATCELTARRLRSRRSRVTVLPCGLDLPRITRTVPSTPVDLVF